MTEKPSKPRPPVTPKKSLETATKAETQATPPDKVQGGSSVGPKGNSRPPDPVATGGASEAALPLTGVDRVLRFADSLATKEREAEALQRLETWVTCRIDRELFGIPVSHVQEVLRVSGLTRVPHAPAPVRGVTNMRGHVLPVVDVRVRLGLPKEEIGTHHRVVVVVSQGRLVGLLVDAVDQVVQIDALKVESPPAEVMSSGSYYISGVYQLAEDLLILLDTDRVLEIRDSDREGEVS
jgi:purine-binding chemotaxis protein CheW